MITTRLLFGALLLLQGATTSWWDTATNKLAEMAGAQCWAVLSLAVQIKGKPFCQATTGSSEFYSQGRDQRIAAVKALGLTLGLSIARSERQRLYDVHRVRLQTLEKALAAGIDSALQVPSEKLRQLHRVATTARVQYRLSTATVLAFSGDIGLTSANAPAVPDPMGSALAARVLAVGNALDQNAAEVVPQTKARAQALREGGDVRGAESGRSAAEAQAMLNYLISTQGISRSQQAQLGTYRLLKVERNTLFTALLNQPGFGVSP